MKLLYIRRNAMGCEVVYDLKTIQYNHIPETVINWMCVENQSTFKGRRNAIKCKYGLKRLTPVFVDDDVLLFPIKAVRDYENIWINYYEIVALKGSYILFRGGKKLMVNSGVVNRQLKKCYEIAF
jgi:competence protein ComK